MTNFLPRPAKVWALVLMCAVLGASPSRAEGMQWTVDPAKSTLGFSGKQTGTPFVGKFGRYTASIDFDPDHPEMSHIKVTVDLASASTGDAQRDAAMPNGDWFDVAHFPQAQFETIEVRKTGANAYEAKGNLTIRGVTQPVVLPFTLDVAGTTAHVKGHADLMRNAFGVGQGSWSTAQWVALEVGVDVDIVATK